MPTENILRKLTLEQRINLEIRAWENEARIVRAINELSPVLREWFSHERVYGVHTLTFLFGLIHRAHAERVAIKADEDLLVLLSQRNLVERIEHGAHRAKYRFKLPQEM